jgi:hypothetical protein
MGMTRTAVTLVVVLLVLGRAVATQTSPIHAPDGDSGLTVISSIAVPPLAGAPFSATVNTTETRYLANGVTVVTTNHRLIARDGRGRVFQERRMVAPEDSAIASQLVRTEVADPVAHTMVVCEVDPHVCELRSYRAATTWTLPPDGPSPDGRSALTRQDLGIQALDGFEVVGTREVLRLALDTDRPLSVTKEFWYAPQLGLNLSTTRWDERMRRTEVFTVTEINPAEPDRSLFKLPNDARLIDYRTPAGSR